MTRIEMLERIAKAAEDVVYGALSLQPNQFNPESYEVSADEIDELTLALSDLAEMEAYEDDYVI